MGRVLLETWVSFVHVYIYQAHIHIYKREGHGASVWVMGLCDIPDDLHLSVQNNVAEVPVLLRQVRQIHLSHLTTGNFGFINERSNDFGTLHNFKELSSA